MTTVQKQHVQSGFSIIEMIIVIAIIGAIIGWIGPRVFGAWQRAKRAGVKTELNTINNAISKFNMDTNRYPKTLRDLVRRPTDEDIASKWEGPYLQDKKVPRDAWGNRYIYRVTPEKEEPYELYSYGSSKGKATPKREWIRVKPAL